MFISCLDITEELCLVEDWTAVCEMCKVIFIIVP